MCRTLYDCGACVRRQQPRPRLRYLRFNEACLLRPACSVIFTDQVLSFVSRDPPLFSPPPAPARPTECVTDHSQHAAEQRRRGHVKGKFAHLEFRSYHVCVPLSPEAFCVPAAMPVTWTPRSKPPAFACSSSALFLSRPRINGHNTSMAVQTRVCLYLILKRNEGGGFLHKRVITQ